ncbi:fibrous sheath-interacting protein 2 [Erinaceus europaeus]|uniref:Fibrous sheath-interacting protein 2 n=1 Tax=Erinaceus europaeus TaxID=9365 RepID=A0ABM3WAI8_ERIEU|nr:fibrous sheath-interacting protein 2 [Erinaceus europaeus]
MELYLSACSKAATLAATETATSSLVTESQQCGDGAHKTHFPGIGAAQLLDMPLGVKLPMIPGSNTVYYTTNLSEKLFRPSYGFNLTDPYCRLLENQYKSLHDPHLRTYYRRKDILKRLKKGGYVTNNNKIVCTLRELNKYRQYLTSLKLDFERNYIREQKMLSKQVNKLQENCQIPRRSEVARFQNMLLQEGTQPIKDQERLIRHRYLDMISRELEQLERTAEEQRLLQLDREDRRQRERARRKLNLRRKMEEEWKTKEMLLLSRIGEDVRREARIEEQRRRCREESDRRKQALLEKKMAYHLQKMQENGIKRDEVEKNAFDYKGQEATYFESFPPKKKKKAHDEVKTVDTAGNTKANKGIPGPMVNNIYDPRNSSKNVAKHSTTTVVYQSDIPDNGTEKVAKKSSFIDSRGTVNISNQEPKVSPQNSPTKVFYKFSKSYFDSQKDEREANPVLNERRSKKLNQYPESGPQAHPTSQGIFPSQHFSNTEQNRLQNCLQEKVTSEELNSIIQNVMTWVVATVTSILYPAITKYEERVRSNVYTVSDGSVLSSDSSSFCSTCSEEFTYRSYTSAATKTLHGEPYAFAVDISLRQPPTSSKPPSAHLKRTVVENTPQMKGQSVAPECKYNRARMLCTYPSLRTCKSDSQLLTSSDISKRKSKDAATETDSLGSSLVSDKKFKSEMKDLSNVFVNFKCNLKGETELVLENIFQEILSDLTQVIPSISSVTAEVFVDQSDPEKKHLFPSGNISSAASEIVDNILEKLQSAVEKKCIEIYSQEDLSINMSPGLPLKPGFPLTRENLTSAKQKPLKAPQHYALEPMRDIAEDMVHVILEKLIALASCKKNELPPLEDTTEFSCQQRMTDPKYILHKKSDKKKCSPELDVANVINKEEVQKLISSILSQSSLVGYVEEAISMILGYVQNELNNERIFASEETVVLLQLLDELFTQLHKEPVKANVRKGRRSRWKKPDVEEKYRLTGTRLCQTRKPGKLFPPINVPGMVLYSEDDSEEIDKIVKNVLDSSFRDEKANIEEQIPQHWFTKRNTDFEHQLSSKPPPHFASKKSQVAFPGEELRKGVSLFTNKEFLKEKSCLNQDIFNQDQKYKIQKTSENIIKSILTDMLKNFPSASSGHLDGKTGLKDAFPASERQLSPRECMGQIFSMSEISTVAKEITDAVLNILDKASSYIPSTAKIFSSSSVHQSFNDSSDLPPGVKEGPNKKPLKIWFDSEKKMKYLSSLSSDSSQPSLLKSEENEPHPVDDINDEITDTVFRRLKLFICPKLQKDFKPSLVDQSSFQAQLSNYTTKVVNIVLRAIQNELDIDKKNLNAKKIDNTKTIPGKRSLGKNDELESVLLELGDKVMSSPLLSYICDILSSEQPDKSSIPLPSDKQSFPTSYGFNNLDTEATLPNRQYKKSFYKQLATPCNLHSISSREGLKKNAKLQVLDNIGETLQEMLCKFIGVRPHSQPSCKPYRKKMEENQQTAPELQSNIHRISNAILEYILAKLCDIDTDTSSTKPGCTTNSESLDIDNLSFASIMDEMAKCTDIISSIVSRMGQTGNNEMPKCKGKIINPMTYKTRKTQEMHANKLKALASDILNVVFAKLEGFANGNIETLGNKNNGNKGSNRKDLESESGNITDVYEAPVQSALYKYAKKVSRTILKAIQTELNTNWLDLRTSVKTPPPEKQGIKNLLHLILDAVSPEMYSETESEERGIEYYRYRPTYGNHLPGGAQSDSFLEEDTYAEQELAREGTSVRDETQADSLKQWVLERTLNKIEVKLREPQKSPIIPIIRNILNEIFQSALVKQLNMFSLPHAHLSGISQNVDEPTAQTSIQYVDKVPGPLVSETDVTVVADDVVRTVLHKLYTAAITLRNASESRYKTITFSTNVSFRDNTYERKPSITVLDENPCTLQSRISVNTQTNVNVVDDIVQAILANLETFATSKVKALFCPQINFTVPVPLSIQTDKTALNKALSARESYSDDPFFSCSAEKANSLSPVSLSKLNTYATEVARKILQGIKHELDKERERSFITHSIVVSESIASQIVNTMLDIVSSKSKCDRNNSDKKSDSGREEGVIEKLFNKNEYRKVLQFQIQDTIESILCDIYKETLSQNNLSFTTPTLECSMAGTHRETSSELFLENANKIMPKLSVPKSDVILMSNDIIDIVLHNLSSAVMLGISEKASTSARLPIALCDMFPKVDYQQLPLTESKRERKAECLPSSRSLKSTYTEGEQIAVVEKKNTQKSLPDPCEENANFITKTIFNRLESFATERIDSLITLAIQSTEKSFVSQELENHTQDNSIVHESSQIESNGDVLKISTESIFSQELTEPAFTNYREKLGSTVHLSKASLKEYADIIASAILKLIKDDLDLEIQKAYTYPNDTSFQENIIVSEIVNSTLKILYEKRSVNEITFYSKDNSTLYSRLTVANEMLLGQREHERNTRISLITKYPLEQSQMALEKKSQRIVLEEIFMQNEESKQKEKTALLSSVKKVLNNVYQRIKEVISHLPPFSEVSHFVPNSKIKLLDIKQNDIFQSHSNSVANDMIESVLEKMYFAVVTTVYEDTNSREVEGSDSDLSPRKTPSMRESKQEGKGSNAARCTVAQVYPSVSTQNASLSEDSLLQYSLLQVEKDLVQMVLIKMVNFISHHLEETLSWDGSAELSHDSKVILRSTPKVGCKASVKARPKITPLVKCKTKQNLVSSGTKAKGKAKLGTGEKTLKDIWSKTVTVLSHIVPASDAKTLLETKLPTSELKMHAKDIVSNILEAVVREFGKVEHTRAMLNVKSDQISAACKIVGTVLQGIYATSNHTLPYPARLSHLDDLKLSKANIGAETLSKPRACFYLENVSSQLEQIFPKEGIFKKTFDKWQADSNDMENEKRKLLLTAENILTEISIRAKELEYSLSLLNLPHLEDCESKFQNHSKGDSSRAEDTKVQINMFGREIVEMLFEKLQLCFLSQMPATSSKETLANRNEQHTAKRVLHSVTLSSGKTQDEMSLDSSNQIVQEIVERTINMLESFVDLQFKHISKYEFSEIVKMPIENLFPVQQRLLSKKTLPKVQPRRKLSEESKSSTVSKENIQNTLLQVHSFHSELFTYAVNIISDMLAIIKNKVDKEISQEEPSSVSTLKENIAVSEIIGILIDQCNHFHESLIQNLPKENLFQGTETTSFVNQVELATNRQMSTPQLKEVSPRNVPSQINVPEFVFYSEETMEKIPTSSSLTSCARASVENSTESSEQMEKHISERMPSNIRYKTQEHSSRTSNFDHFDQVMEGDHSLPEGSILQKLFKKSNESTEATLKEVMAFIEMGKGENTRLFQYETPKPTAEPNKIYTSVSPLKICLAAENIVNTVLSSYGLPSQSHTNENMETMKPFFVSNQNPCSVTSAGRKKEEKSLTRLWGKKFSNIPEDEGRNPGASMEDFSLLKKWKTRLCPEVKALKEFEVIAFADHELGPNEIHLVARHVTTSVISYFKNMETRVSIEEMVSVMSTLSRENYESNQILRNIFNDTSLYQFCEYLTESVIGHLISSISDTTEDSGGRKKTWLSKDRAFDKIISIDSCMFESRSISVGELALSISETITGILFNSNILQVDIAHQDFSLKSKYLYCSRIAAVDLDDLFQDLLIAVIHVLSKEIGMNHHLESSGRNQAFSMQRNNNAPLGSKIDSMERQNSSKFRGLKSPTRQTDRLVKKGKLNYLACKLDNLVSSLKTRESKEIVNKVFKIVLDLFLPDECPNETMDSDKTARTFFFPSNDQQGNNRPENNLGLTPKSVFLLNVICEKLIRTLLEKCTNTVCPDSDSLSDETSAEERQLIKILQSIGDEEFDNCKRAVDSEQFQEDFMTNFLENLEETDQDALPSDCMLTFISHSLVKSLMDKLSHSLQLPQNPPHAKKHLTGGKKQTQSSYTKAKRSKQTGLGEGKDSLESISDDSNALSRSQDSPSMLRSKVNAPFGKKHLVNSCSLFPPQKKENNMYTMDLHSRPDPEHLNTSVYSATFLEDIISELFFNLSTSLCGLHENVTESRLNEMNTLFVHNVVREFNKARVTVLRDPEEKLYFPPVHKETISRIVDSVYYDVLQQYQLNVTHGNKLTPGDNSLGEQITNGILLEVLDYRLPSCFTRQLKPSSYHPLNADIILLKLQNKLIQFTSPLRSSTGYSTMLSQSFLEDTIRRLLSQLIPLPSKTSCLRNKHFMSSDFNEMSTTIVDKVMSAISKHKIWFTVFDNQDFCTEKNLEKMVDSVYSNILQICDSPITIQSGIVSQSPIVVDQIASLIIQEIIENHLQPFLSGEGLSCPKSPSDPISYMVKQVLSEVINSHRPCSSNICPDAFIGDVVAKLLSKIFSTKERTDFAMENIAQKIVNSISSHFDKAKIHILNNDKEKAYYPSIDTDVVDELVTSVYRNVLKQHGLDPETGKEYGNSDNFVGNITKLLIPAISDYFLHPLFSGDSSASPSSVSIAENIVPNILSNISKYTQSSQSLSPYNTLLPYTFLEDMIRALLSRIFPAFLSRETPKDTLRENFNEIASKLISDIRMKISQHEIRFSKDEEETKIAYSEDDVQCLVDSVFKNILQSPESQESFEENITSSNETLIDRIAGFIIKHVCQQHLQPFVGRKSLSSSYPYFDQKKEKLNETVYSSTFLEDVISGVLNKIFHRVLGIVQAKPVRDSEDKLLDKAENLIHLIAEEFSETHVSVLENAEEQFCLPPVERDVVVTIIDRVYSKVLQECELEIMHDKDFFNDMKSLAAKITKVILTESFDFQIPPSIAAKIPFKFHSKLNTDVLIERIKCNMAKSKLQKHTSSMYTTILTHTHLEKIVTQLLSQMDPSVSGAEHSEYSKSDLNNTVVKLINEIMSIISKHAICITKHGNEKKCVISGKDTQSMVDSIYDDLLNSDLYQSLIKDKKGLSNIPVSKIASFILKEIFDHHLQSFLSEDKTFLSTETDQTCKQKAMEPEERELFSIVNSDVFLEEVISELLSKLLYAFSHNVLAVEHPDVVKAKITEVVTTLVNSIVLELTTSEILVTDNFDRNKCFSEEYKEMRQKTVNVIYAKILDEYKSLVHIYRAIQCDTICFGRKIYHFLLDEIYEYQVQSLISGQLASSSYSAPQAENIIRNVLNVVANDSHVLPSCITMVPHSLLEDMIYKLLVNAFPPSDTPGELQKGEASPDCEFVDAASKLTAEILEEIAEHEIRLATEEQNAEGKQLEGDENFVETMCDNILKKSAFQTEVQHNASKKGSSFLSKIAGFIIREIMDHHLKPFLNDRESPSRGLTHSKHVSALTKPDKEKIQPSIYSARFLEDIIVNLVRKFYSLLSSSTNLEKKEMPEPDFVDLAIQFAKSLVGEFTKSEIKVVPNAEEVFSFSPIDKETVDKISDFVYDQFISQCGSKDIQENNTSNILIKVIAELAQEAISAFKIQPLFSGDLSSTIFSFLNPDKITKRVQHLPQKSPTEVSRCLKEDQINLLEQSRKQTSSTTDQKILLDPCEDFSAVNRKKTFKTDKASEKNDTTSDTTIINILNNVVNLLSGSTASDKKCLENKSPTKKYKDTSETASPATNLKMNDAQERNMIVALEKCKVENSLSASKGKRQGNEEFAQSPVAIDDVKYKEVLGHNFEIDDDKIDKAKETFLEKDDKSFRVSTLTSDVRTTGSATEHPLETTTKKSSSKENKDTSTQIYVYEEQDCGQKYERVQNVIENVYDNILGMFQPQESDHPKFKIAPNGTQAQGIQDVDKDFSQPVSTKKLLPSSNLCAKGKREKEKDEERWGQKNEEKVKGKDTEMEPRKPESPRYPPKRKLGGIFPAKFLEDVITEMVNRLIFSSSAEMQTHQKWQDSNGDEDQVELCNTAMKLIDSLLKEFADAQIKVFKTDNESNFLPKKDNIPSAPQVLPSHREPTKDEARASMRQSTVGKIPYTNKIGKQFLDKTPATDKTLVNRIVHASVCNVLKEYRSQESICRNIESNEGNLARRLTSAMIKEFFQNKLNLSSSDEISASTCLPLESKDIVQNFQKVIQTTSRECQTSTPYIVMLTHEFLENVISALLSKIFSTISNTAVETSEDEWLTEKDFLQMKLLSTIKAEISKDEDMIIQYVESLHHSDDEIIQLVVQSIYNNLLSQFGSHEIIQECISSGCKILSEAIVNLVLREVAGNQLQNYFSGELTPNQYAEIDNVVDNILKTVIQTADFPKRDFPSQSHVLPFNIIEEIAVKFLSKLLSVFPKLDNERNKSLEMEMQKITSKILNSVQDFISKSKIKLVPPARELLAAADNAIIEKVVNSVYTNVLKHSGSHTSVFKDLMGKSNVLSDIIGFLLVKEISNSKFQPQVEEEVSNSELVLEAVKIMEKVVKIVDEFKSKEKFSSKKVSMLDAKFLEEALALFMAKIIRLSRASSKDKKILSKTELNKITSQLTKSVTAEIAKDDINLIAADPEDQSLKPESIEIISQVIDSIYSDVLRQSGSHKELYHDIKGVNKVFPKEVASLIVRKVSNFSLDAGNLKKSNVGLFRDLDVNRIVQKAQEYADTRSPELEESDIDTESEDEPMKIVPYIGNKPIKIDPLIISEHLAVISVKTQPIETLKKECLRNTGHSIAELRRASISGKTYHPLVSSNINIKRERRISLDRTGRLATKPFEAVCRNSFQNIRKPDITKVELLKDVQSKKELIIRLVAHDIDPEYTEINSDDDEKEVVLRETVQESLEQVTVAMEPVEDKVSPKPMLSTSSLKKFLSLSKCCQSTSIVNIESIKPAHSNRVTESEREVKRAVAELDMASCSAVTQTHLSWEKKTQQKKEEMNIAAEPTHYFIHRIMSTSSYNQEDLISSTGEIEDGGLDASAKVSEGNSQENTLENSDSVKFITIFEGNKNNLGNAQPSKGIISETPKASISKQGSQMLAKVSSAFSKVFSQTNTNIFKSSSHDQDEH